METHAIGERLVELCRQGKNLEAVDELYAQDVVSVEATGDAAMPREMKGIDAVREKNQWWIDNHEVHDGQAAGPFPHDDRFAVYFRYDVTPTGGPASGQRMEIEEVALYTVEGGKIKREEFFYQM